MKRLAYISILLFTLGGCVKMPVDWSPYFESQYTQPYGTKVMVEVLEELYPYSDVEVIKNRSQDYIADWYDREACFMYINTRFWPDSAFYEDLLNFNSEGNSLFIATEGENACFDKHGISQAHQNIEQYKLSLHYLYGGKQSYTIDNRPNNAVSYFTKYPSYAKILGTVQIGDSTYPNFISLNRQDGTSKIFLHANPELFSNYHLLHKKDGLYSLRTLAHIKQASTFLWDGYGTKRRYTTPPSDGDATGLLRYIKANKSLSFGFGLLLLALILFFVFNYKRVTRSMLLHLPKKNNSVAFMKLIAGLFKHQENHIDLAKYRANYMLDRIKDKYFVEIGQMDDDFTQKLAQKSTLTESDLAPLTRQLKKIRNTNYLNEEDFIRFCKIVEPYIDKLSLK